VYILLGVIKELAQLLDTDSSALQDLESWLLRLCKEQSIGKLIVFHMQQHNTFCGLCQAEKIP
jgi:hypothetical protein